MKSLVLLRSGVHVYWFALHHSVGKALVDSFHRKNQYIWPLLRPYHLVRGMTGQAVRPIYIHLASHNYSTCITYNFFIFCPICLKFSHKFLHTYSFILNIKKQNWKISQFWVVDPLKCIFWWYFQRHEASISTYRHLAYSEHKFLAFSNLQTKLYWIPSMTQAEKYPNY